MGFDTWCSCRVGIVSHKMHHSSPPSWYTWKCENCESDVIFIITIITTPFLKLNRFTDEPWEMETISWILRNENHLTPFTSHIQNSHSWLSGFIKSWPWMETIIKILLTFIFNLKWNSPPKFPLLSHKRSTRLRYCMTGEWWRLPILKHFHISTRYWSRQITHRTDDRSSVRLIQWHPTEGGWSQD